MSALANTVGKPGNVVQFPQQESEAAYQPAHVVTDAQLAPAGKAVGVIAVPPSLVAVNGLTTHTAMLLTQLAYYINRYGEPDDSGMVWIDRTRSQIREQWLTQVTSDRTIIRYTQRLVEFGYIAVKQRRAREHGRDSRNSYALTWAGAWLLAAHGVELRQELWELLPDGLRHERLNFSLKQDKESRRRVTKSHAAKGQRVTPQGDNLSLAQGENSIEEESESENHESHVEKQGREGVEPESIASLVSWLETRCNRGSDKNLAKAVERLIQLSMTEEKLNLVYDRMMQRWPFNTGRRPHYSQVVADCERRIEEIQRPPSSAAPPSLFNRYHLDAMSLPDGFLAWVDANDVFSRGALTSHHLQALIKKFESEIEQ